MATKKNDVKSAAEKVVKKEAAAPVKAAKEEKPAEVKKAEVKAEVKAEKPAEKKAEVKAEKPAEKKAEKAVKEEKPAKKAPAKKPAAKAEKADAVVYFEFAGRQVKAADVTKAVEAACKANGVKSADVKGVKIYVKAEDSAAYYVLANGKTGKVDL